MPFAAGTPAVLKRVAGSRPHCGWRIVVADCDRPREPPERRVRRPWQQAMAASTTLTRVHRPGRGLNHVRRHRGDSSRMTSPGPLVPTPNGRVPTRALLRPPTGHAQTNAPRCPISPGLRQASATAAARHIGDGGRCRGELGLRTVTARGGAELGEAFGDDRPPHPAAALLADDEAGFGEHLRVVADRGL